MTNSEAGLIGARRRKQIGGYGKGPLADNWKGGRSSRYGYPSIYSPDHPRAKLVRYVFEHILIAEAVLGKFLPTDAVIHHVDENRSNNVRQNLVICENRAYHNLLHRRMRALRACGNPRARLCWHCNQWDSPDRLIQYSSQTSAVHPECKQKYEKRKRIERLSR